MVLQYGVTLKKNIPNIVAKYIYLSSQHIHNMFDCLCSDISIFHNISQQYLNKAGSFYLALLVLYVSQPAILPKEIFFVYIGSLLFPYFI